MEITVEDVSLFLTVVDEGGWEVGSSDLGRRDDGELMVEQCSKSPSGRHHQAMDKRQGQKNTFFFERLE